MLRSVACPVTKQRLQILQLFKLGGLLNFGVDGIPRSIPIQASSDFIRSWEDDAKFGFRRGWGFGCLNRFEECLV